MGLMLITSGNSFILVGVDLTLGMNICVDLVVLLPPDNGFLDLVDVGAKRGAGVGAADAR